MYRAATLWPSSRPEETACSPTCAAGRSPASSSACASPRRSPRLCPSDRGSRMVTCCPPARDQGAVSHQIGPAEARVPPGDVIGMYHDRPPVSHGYVCSGSGRSKPGANLRCQGAAGQNVRLGVSCSRRVTNWVTIARFLAAWGRAFPVPGPRRHLMVPWDAYSAAKATWCQPKAIDTSSSSPLYQSLAGWAPISAVEVLEMDPTAAVVVPTTVPSTTVSIWLAVLMH